VLKEAGERLAANIAKLPESPCGSIKGSPTFDARLQSTIRYQAAYQKD